MKILSLDFGKARILLYFHLLVIYDGLFHQIWKEHISENQNHSMILLWLSRAKIIKEQLCFDEKSIDFEFAGLYCPSHSQAKKRGKFKVNLFFIKVGLFFFVFALKKLQCHAYLTSYVFTEHIFDSRPFIYNKIFQKKSCRRW